MTIFTSLQQHIDSVCGALRVLNQYEIERAVRILEKVRTDGGTVWLVGNGGSASTASHFANDLEKMAGVRAISVPDMLPKILAYGNDNGWDRMFSDIISRNIGRGDAVVAISCSGNSVNVVRAAESACGFPLIVLTGNDEDCLLCQQGASVILHAPVGDIRAQEDVHLAICHAIVGALV